MVEDQLYHITYISTGRDNLRYEDVKGILESSNVNNKAEGITGILVYCNKHFFQIIEGSKEAVKEIFQKIQVDCRHDNIVKIQEGPIECRQFDSWNMAFKSYNKELNELDDFNNEQFYSYINSQLGIHNDVSLRVLADFFDLNG
jgi:hypothetical protein